MVAIIISSEPRFRSSTIYKQPQRFAEVRRMMKVLFGFTWTMCVCMCLIDMEEAKDGSQGISPQCNFRRQYHVHFISHRVCNTIQDKISLLSMLIEPKRTHLNWQTKNYLDWASSTSRPCVSSQQLFKASHRGLFWLQLWSELWLLSQQAQWRPEESQYHQVKGF